MFPVFSCGIDVLRIAKFGIQFIWGQNKITGKQMTDENQNISL